MLLTRTRERPREHRVRRRHLLRVVVLCATASIGLPRMPRHPDAHEAQGVAELSVTRRVEHPGSLVREPMVVEHPDGTLFVSGYSRAADAHPQLWKSADHGVRWSPVSLGSEADGAVGNSDVDLAIGPKGTIYLVQLDFDRAARAGRGVAIGVSSDGGATWSWHTLSRAQFVDRPWVDVAPDGTAHAVWNDGHGVAHAVSSDQGRTWTEVARVSDSGGSSHLAIGPNGELAMRLAPLSAAGSRRDPDANYVAVSTNGGNSWSLQRPPSPRNWAPFVAMMAGQAIPRWVEPLAWDSAGALYDLWTDSSGVWVSRSRDHGMTWDSWRVAEPPSGELAFYPYLVARGRGELALTWFSQRLFGLDVFRQSPDSVQLRWHAALVSIPESAVAPVVRKSDPLPIDAWERVVVQGDTLTGPSTAGEYLAVTFIRTGGVAAVTPVQGPAGNRTGFTFWQLTTRP